MVKCGKINLSDVFAEIYAKKDRMDMDTLLLNASDIKSLITIKEVVDICDQVFCGFGEGTVDNPSKVHLGLGDNGLPPHYNAGMNAMPAYIGFQDLAGLKWAGGFNGKRVARGLPFLNAMILLCDPQMGNFLSVMDGTLITNMRTGGQTAAIMRYLFPGQKKVRVGLYGAGAQARTQTMAVASVFDIDQLTVYDVFPAAAQKFKADMEEYVKGSIIVADRPEQAAQGDVVISVTLATDGFIKKDWISPGTVYFALGSFQEAEYAVFLDADHIVVDHIGQTMHRGALKELVDMGKLSEKDITGTVSQLALGRLQLGEIKKQRLVVVPIGMGCLDVAVAGVVYEKAISRSMGEYFVFDL